MTHHQVLRDPAFEAEYRTDRSYDETQPGHVVHPNGSLVGSLDRGFLGAAARAARAALAAYERRCATCHKLMTPNEELGGICPYCGELLATGPTR